MKGEILMENLYEELLGFLKLEDKESTLNICMQALEKRFDKCDSFI